MAVPAEGNRGLVDRLPANLSVLDVIIRYARWQYFCTFTLRGHGTCTPKVGLPGVMLVLRKQASRLGVPFPRLVWCLRLELGERTARPHYHALMAAEGQGARKPTIGNCHRLGRVWFNQYYGGFADVRLYESRLHGEAYVVKCLGYGDTSGANGYELKKFGQGMDLILSDSLIRYLSENRMRSTVDGSEGDHWSEGGQQVTSAEKWARCEVSEERIRFYRIPSLTVKLSPKHGMERLSTEPGFGQEAWGGWHFGIKALTPDKLAMLRECVKEASQ